MVYKQRFLLLVKFFEKISNFTDLSMNSNYLSNNHKQQTPFIKEVCNGGVACSLDGGWQATPSITKFLNFHDIFFLLQEVANSPDLDPTLTFNVGGLKSTRRASFGRRVSFSASTKIKEFRTDGPDLTTWNSTYEEERSNLNSDSSSQRSDSDVLADGENLV